MTYLSEQNVNVRNILSKKKLQDVLSQSFQLNLLAKISEKPLSSITCAQLNFLQKARIWFYWTDLLYTPTWHYLWKHKALVSVLE